MFNTKTAATVIAAVAVAGVSVQQIITRTRKSAVTTEPTAQQPSLMLTAFNLAQDKISERMLDGYYDDKTNDEAAYDFQIMYNTYLCK